MGKEIDASAAEWRKHGTLKLWRGNVKEAHDEEGIAASIIEWGWGEVIVARRANGQIIGGHGRSKAAVLLMKMWAEASAAERKKWHPDARRTGESGEVPVRFLDISQADAAELAVSLNRLAELSKWKAPALHRVLSRVNDSRLAAMGFSSAQVAKLVKKAATITTEDDPTELVLPDAPETQPGDLWILGVHRVLCADATHVESYTELLGSEEPGAVVTDPPFAIYGSASGIGSDIADDKMVRPFFEAFFRLATHQLKKFGHVYVHTDWRSWAAMWEAASRVGLSPKNMIVWDKGNGGLGSSWGNCHELVGFFAKLPKAKSVRSTQETGQRTVFKSNILRYPRVAGAERLDNAAKPVGLEAELIEAGTERGELVLDPYLGSGSTLIACEKTGRRCYGFDIEPKKCDVIARRWAKATGKEPQRVPAKERDVRGAATADDAGDEAQ